MVLARLAVCLAVLVASAAVLTGARAAPLDAETCTKLQAEQGKLQEAGVENDMAKGPEWARDNLGLEKLQRVQRFIELEEQLLFRCRSKAIVSANADKDDDDEDNDSDDNDGDDKEGAAKAGTDQARGADLGQKPAAKSKSRTKSTKPAKAGAGESGVTSIAKRPPKAKVDDAYKVPPPDPSVDPFANRSPAEK